MGAAKGTTNVGEGIHPLRYVLFGLAVICSLMSIYVFLDYQTSSEAKLSGELILGQIDTAVYPEKDSPITGFFFEYVGLMCYGLSLLFGYIGYYAFIKKFSIWTIDFYKLSLRVLGFNLLLLGLTAFFSRFGILKSTGAGGLLGDMLNLVCDFALPPILSIVIFLIVTYFGVCLFAGFSGFALFDLVGEKLFRLIYGNKEAQEVENASFKAKVNANQASLEQSPQNIAQPAQQGEVLGQNMGGISELMGNAQTQLTPNVEPSFDIPQELPSEQATASAQLFTQVAEPQVELPAQSQTAAPTLDQAQSTQLHAGPRFNAVQGGATNFFAIAQNQGQEQYMQPEQESVQTQESAHQVENTYPQEGTNLNDNSLYVQQPLGMQGGMQGRDGLQGMAETFGQVQPIEDLPEETEEIPQAQNNTPNSGSGVSEQASGMMPDNAYMQGASFGYEQDFSQATSQVPSQTPAQNQAPVPAQEPAQTNIAQLTAQATAQYTQAFEPQSAPQATPENAQNTQVAPAPIASETTPDYSEMMAQASADYAEMISEPTPDYSEMMAQAAAAGGVLEHAGTVAQAIAKTQAQEAQAELAAREAQLQAEQGALAENARVSLDKSPVQEQSGNQSLPSEQAQYEQYAQYEQSYDVGSEVGSEIGSEVADESHESQDNFAPAENPVEPEEEASPYRVGVRRRPVVQSSSDSEESPYRVGVMNKDSKKAKAKAEVKESVKSAESDKAERAESTESAEDKGPSTVIISSDSYGHSLAPSDFAQQTPQSQTTFITHEPRATATPHVSDESAYGTIGGASLTAEALASYGSKHADNTALESQEPEQAGSVEAEQAPATLGNAVSSTAATTEATPAAEPAVATSAPTVKSGVASADTEVNPEETEQKASLEQTSEAFVEPETKADAKTEAKVEPEVELKAAAESEPETEPESIYITPGVAKNKKVVNADKASDKVESSSQETAKTEDEEEEAVHTIIQKVDPEVFAAQQAAAKAAREKAEKEEAERRAKEAAEQLAREEAERKAKEEEEARIAAEKAEAERKAQEEAKAKEEAELKAKEEAQKAKAQAEAEAKAEAEQAQEEEEDSLYMGTYANKLKRNQKRKPKSDKSDKSDKAETQEGESGESSSVDTVVIRSSNTLTPAPITSESTDSPFAAFNAAREKAEAERKAQEEALAKIREAAEAKARAEAEAERLAQEEEERKLKEESEKKAQEEAQRQAQLKLEQEQQAAKEAEAQVKVQAELAEEEDEDEDSPYITPGVRHRKKKKVVSSAESSKDAEPSTIIQYGPTPTPSNTISTNAQSSNVRDNPTLGATLASAGEAAGVVSGEGAGVIAGVGSGVGAGVAAAAGLASAAVESAETVAKASSIEHEGAEHEAAWDELPKSPQHDRLSAEYQKMLSDAERAHDGSISYLIASMSGSGDNGEGAEIQASQAAVEHTGFESSERGQEESSAPSTLITTSDSSANKEHLDRFTSSFDPYNPAYVAPSKSPTPAVTASAEQELTNGPDADAVAVMQSAEGSAPVSSAEVEQASASVRQSSVIDFTQGMGTTEPSLEHNADDSSFLSVDAQPAHSATAVEPAHESDNTTIISRGEGMSRSDAFAHFEDHEGSGNTAIYRAPESSAALNMEDDDGFYKYAVTENNVKEAQALSQDSLGESEPAFNLHTLEKSEAKPHKAVRTSHFSFTDMAREEEERKRLVALDHETQEEPEIAETTLPEETALAEETSVTTEPVETTEPEVAAEPPYSTHAHSNVQSEAMMDSIVQGVQVGTVSNTSRAPAEAVAPAPNFAPHSAPSQSQTRVSESMNRVERAKENIISFTNFSNKERDESSYEVNKLTSAFIPMDEEGIVSGNTEMAQPSYESKSNVGTTSAYEKEVEQAEESYSEHGETHEAVEHTEAESHNASQGTSGTSNGNMMQAMPNQNVQGMPYMTMPNGQYMPMMQQGMPMYQNMGMPMNGMQYVQMPNGQYMPMMANNNMLYQQQMLQAQALQQAQQVALQQQLAQQQVQAARQAAEQVVQQALQQAHVGQMAQSAQGAPSAKSTQGSAAAASAMATPSEYAGHETPASYGAATTSSMDNATAALASAETEHHASDDTPQADPHTMGEHGAQGNGLPTAGNAFMGAHNSSSSHLPSYMAGVSQTASFDQPRSLSLCTVPRHKFGSWRPSLDLLAVSHDRVEITEEDLAKTSERINEVLHSYGVKATVADYLTGPVITRFDLELARGVKSSAISSLETELCRNLLVPNVRVVPIIEGSPYVGLEVPNAKRQFITLGDMVSSSEFQNSKASLPMMLGASVVGDPVIKDLAETPHLLVAGTTGSGKSAGLNTMLISLLLKRSPEELRLILVDPKQLEFSIYKDLPHLITPVITDVAEKTAIALNWCVDEMERRFKLMSLLGVRKLSEYNDLVKAEKARGSSIPDPLWTPEMGPVPQGLEPLPWIVVVVEEFADLMAQSARKKDKDKTPEGYIARLTAKSRAAGIHLVLVTQTPRSEVVNGMIKANIPSRIAFTVQNRLDSSIVLDEKGAECLLGNGDMLYKFSGSNTATRAHGSFTSNDDVKRVVSAWRAQSAPEYLADVITAPPDPEAEIEADAESAEQKLDVKFDQAAEIAREYLERRNKPPSITDLQNDLGVGFPRAKKIYKQLIKEGILEE